MALSGIQIYKLLPKTNCKDCGFPTCLAFAMKLAAKQAELSACPHVSEEAAAELSEASELGYSESQRQRDQSGERGGVVPPREDLLQQTGIVHPCTR